MIDRDSGRVSAPHSGNDGEGSDWRDGYDPPACACSPGNCLISCQATGCRGYARAVEDASGLPYRFDPRDCAALQ